MPDYYSNSTYLLQKKPVMQSLLQKHVTLPRDYFQLLQTQLAEKTAIKCQIPFIFFLDRGRKENIILYKDIYFFNIALDLPP